MRKIIVGAQVSVRDASAGWTDREPDQGARLSKPADRGPLRARGAVKIAGPELETRTERGICRPQAHAARGLKAYLWPRSTSTGIVQLVVLNTAATLVELASLCRARGTRGIRQQLT
jgi:hypothetical protein